MNTDPDDSFWSDLLDLIETGRVIPVLGAGVVTRGDDEQLLYPWLARRLAEELRIPLETLPTQIDLNSVATAHLLNHGKLSKLYTSTGRILKNECPAPGQALLDIASISAFNFYLSTTIDPLLQNALDLVRYGGQRHTTSYALLQGDELRERDIPCEIKELRTATIFNLLGKVTSFPQEYVVWEEDILEFVFILNKHMPERLGRELKKQGLLILGLDFSDWLVRFFIRATKQERLSGIQVHTAYVSDRSKETPPDSLVLFFGAVSKEIHVMRQNPIAFCAELARRWKERHPEDRPIEKLAALPSPQNMPRGAVFISYAREDEAAVVSIVRGLQSVGCVVWYDRDRLKSGQNWHNSLEDEVKTRCALFLSVISRTTESTRESYYHLERNWAAVRAERISHDEEFYIPVVIDDSPIPPAREPRVFHHVQATPVPEGAISADFAAHILSLQRRAMEAPL